MSRKTRAAWLLGMALLAPSALSAQVMPVASKARPAAPTAPSAAAATAFRSALYESQNVGGPRARKQIDAAVAADPQFGLARVYQVVLTQRLTPAEREARITEILRTSGPLSPFDSLLATYWREAAAGRGPAAAPIIRAAAELAPADPEINYLAATVGQGARPVAEQVARLRAFVERFPRHAAAYNQLAYTLWRAGDREGALAMVQKYAELAPNHPNSHDSYSDILILLGREEEAVPHMQRAKQLDPQWPLLDAKLGVIALTGGDVEVARTHFTAAMAATSVPAEQIEVAQWLAATRVYQKNGRAAGVELEKALQVAEAAKLPGAVVNAHAQSAVIDAYIGNRQDVARHLHAAHDAAATDAQKANYLALAAVALSELGQAEQARSALAQLRATPGVDAEGISGIEAILALDQKDYEAAAAAIQKLDRMALLTSALRAELLLRTGNKTEGEALRKQVLASSVKFDGNQGVEFPSLIGRMRLMTR